MSAAAGPGLGGLGRRSKREVVDVPEPKLPDRRLDQLLHVRKQRLGRLERERNEARQQWRARRDALHDCKLARRAALARASDFWQASRAEFFQMSITSGQFRKAKAVYERMKEEAAHRYLLWREQVVRCREAQTQFFSALEQVLLANRQQEKLAILRDELRLLARQNEE